MVIIWGEVGAAKESYEVGAAIKKEEKQGVTGGGSKVKLH